MLSLMILNEGRYKAQIPPQQQTNHVVLTYRCSLDYTHSQRAWVRVREEGTLFRKP